MLLLCGERALYRDHRHVIEGMPSFKHPIDNAARRIGGGGLRLCSQGCSKGRLPRQDVPRRFNQPVGIEEE